MKSLTRILHLTALQLILSLSVVAQEPWKYNGNLDERCVPATSVAYSYQNTPVGSHGGDYSVYREGVSVLGGGGDFGCCGVKELIVFTDDIVLVVINNAGLNPMKITSNGGSSWKDFNSVVPFYEDIAMVNAHTAYSIGINLSRVFLGRNSDWNAASLMVDSLVYRKSNEDIYIYDTIYGDKVCPETDTIGFSVTNDTIVVNYHVIISQTLPDGVEEEKEVVQVKVYPNPSKGIFTLKSTQQLDVEVYDITGQIIYTGHLSDSEGTIDLSDYQRGMYLLKCYTPSGSYYSGRIILN